MFEELFVRKKLNVKKLISYGFKPSQKYYKLSKNFSDNFTLNILISSDGKVDTKIIDDTNEEYILYKIESSQGFAAEIRKKCEKILKEISEKCYETEIFKSAQTKILIKYVKEKYGDDLQYLWQKFPDNAVWKRKDNQKWYGAVLTVEKNKLGLSSADKAEIVDLRIQPEKMKKLLSKPHYYPGWHMNKKSWFTIILDGSVSDKELCKRLDESYAIALKH